MQLSTAVIYRAEMAVGKENDTRVELPFGQEQTLPDGDGAHQGASRTSFRLPSLFLSAMAPPQRVPSSPPSSAELVSIRTGSLLAWADPAAALARPGLPMP